MVFNPDHHEIDAKTGYVIHKETGARVGLDPAVPVAAHDQEFPKWVEPHESLVIRKKTEGAPDSVVVPGWHSEVERGGKVKVLVHDAAQEAKAMAAKVEAAVEREHEPKGDDDPT